MLGTFTSVLHAGTAVVLDITPGPETLPETLLDMFASSAAGGVCWTCGPKGGGDLSTGTVPLSSSVRVHSFSHGMLGTFAVVSDGLPIAS